MKTVVCRADRLPKEDSDMMAGRLLNEDSGIMADRLVNEDSCVQGTQTGK